MGMAVLFVLAAISFIAGFAAFRLNSTLYATIAETISRLTMFAAILILGLFIAPKAKEVFIGFGTELPGLTVWVLTVSDQMMTSWPILIINFFSTTISDTILFTLYHRKPEAQERVRVISLIATVTLILVLSAAATAVFWPMRNLLEDLA